MNRRHYAIPSTRHFKLSGSKNRGRAMQNPRTKCHSECSCLGGVDSEKETKLGKERKIMAAQTSTRNQKKKEGEEKLCHTFRRLPAAGGKKIGKKKKKGARLKRHWDNKGGSRFRHLKKKRKRRALPQKTRPIMTLNELKIFGGPRYIIYSPGFGKKGGQSNWVSRRNNS